MVLERSIDGHRVELKAIRFGVMDFRVIAVEGSGQAMMPGSWESLDDLFIDLQMAVSLLCMLGYRRIDDEKGVPIDCN